jgi:hypothetical protein
MNPPPVAPQKSNRVLNLSLAGTLVVAAGLLVWLCALLPGGSSGGTRPFGSLPELDLYEPVVRFLLPRAAAAAGAKRPVVYIGLPDAESAGQFCDRFRGQPVAVLPWSGDPAQVPGEAAYFIRISTVSGEKVQWEGPDQARVFVLDYPVARPPDCGTPYPVRVRREGGRWAVVEH